jgi:hypothetical protein
MYKHKLSNFQKTFNSLIKEHQQDEKEDARLEGEIKAIVASCGADGDKLEEAVAAIMEKVKAHCDMMSNEAYSSGKEAGLDAAYQAQF